jgi:SAM-dependent methyltransferase
MDAHFQDGSFDIVFMGDVLEHLPDPLSTLREVHRILPAGGLLVLGVPSQTNSLFSRFGFQIFSAIGKRANVALPPYHLFEYRPASLRFLLRECGFRVAELTQGMIAPNRINLRGPALQRLGKKLFQYPNWVLTSIFGICGDRLAAFAVKETPGTGC